MPTPGYRATHCIRGHPFSGDNVFISQGKQRCRDCHRRAGREHYQRLAAVRPVAPPRPSICAVDGCERASRGRQEWCDRHYRRLIKYGDLETVLVYRGDPLHRFWSKVNEDAPIPTYRPDLGPCWIWTGALNDTGYGSLYWDGRTQPAHRVSLEIAGRPAGTLHVDHLCRVHPCVKPTHLEAVTPAENIRRGDADYRARWTTCAKGHPFDEANTHRNRAGKRVCRTCSRQRVAARKARAA